ncbi:MAG: radical SAM protein, partial [Oscillospiraceae bacterium]
MATIENYIRYLEKTGGTLFDETCRANWRRVAAQYGEMESEETIAEVNLTRPDKTCDYSFRVDTGKTPVGDYWYELDHEACLKSPVEACCFMDASAVEPGADNSWVFEEALPRLLPPKALQGLRAKLEQCIACLPKGSRLFQLGVMAGRGDSRVRLFTDDLPPKAVCGYLAAAGWPGNLPALEALLEALVPYAEEGRFLVDFDVAQSGLSEKLGVNFGIQNSEGAIETFFAYLSGQGLCLPEKRDGVLQWVKTPPQASPFIQNDISHFKLPFWAGRAQAAKAYLRQGSKMCREVAFYHRPVLMNLELTSRCPLRCPQCYCDLETGRDMPLETALGWIRKAGKAGVQTVNLSGGETLCYPHLYPVAAEAARLCGEVNVALSGAGFGAEALGRLKEAGVSGIYISLNGSTSLVNAHSRDGYDLAVQALQLLQTEGFGRVGINWVMHSTNADDFEEMVALAERYGVHELAVMVFKPNARHQLPTLPTLAQMQAVAKTIKTYKGPLDIQVEECFSPLRALVRQKFFGNLNRGVEKGCGAGRDSFAVALDGRLTPCRHLDYPEERASVGDYWDNIPTLQAVRQCDAFPAAPCNACRYSPYCRPCMAVA